MAFLVCVGFGVYGAMQRLMYCVPAPLNAALCAKGEYMSDQVLKLVPKDKYFVPEINSAEKARELLEGFFRMVSKLK